MANIAINGFGRIGRQVYKVLADRFPSHNVVAVNDITDTETLVHLLRHDSTYGAFSHEIEAKGDGFACCGKMTKVLACKDFKELPWKDLGVDVVIESTGKLKKSAEAMDHIQAGARKVVVSAPIKEPDFMVVRGVNCNSYDPSKHTVISNASCTTNSLAPVVKILNEKFRITKGFMTTVHSYTNDQRILDGPHKDLRRARNAATNIIPTTTGAAEAVAVIFPELKGKMTGISLRVPTQTVSITDFVCTVEDPTSVEEVNSVLHKASHNELKGILGFSTEPLVSSDYIGSSYSGVVDALSTMLVGSNMIKVLIWYDNEWGYSNRTAEMVDIVANRR